MLNGTLKGEEGDRGFLTVSVLSEEEISGTEGAQRGEGLKQIAYVGAE